MFYKYNANVYNAGSEPEVKGELNLCIFNEKRCNFFCRFFSRNLKPVQEHKIKACQEFIPQVRPQVFYFHICNILYIHFTHLLFLNTHVEVVGGGI